MVTNRSETEKKIIHIVSHYKCLPKALLKSMINADTAEYSIAMKKLLRRNEVFSENDFISIVKKITPDQHMLSALWAAVKLKDIDWVLDAYPTNDAFSNLYFISDGNSYEVVVCGLNEGYKMKKLRHIDEESRLVIVVAKKDMINEAPAIYHRHVFATVEFIKLTAEPDVTYYKGHKAKKETMT